MDVLAILRHHHARLWAARHSEHNRRSLRDNQRAQRYEIARAA